MLAAAAIAFAAADAAAQLAGGSSHTNATVTAAGSSTPRTLASRFSEIRNVKDFGAVGNGSTDDTKAIQAAIAAAQAEGGTVQFPPSAASYVVGQLTISAPVTVDCGGQLLTLTGANARIYLSGTVPNVTIRHCRINGSGLLADNQIAVLTSGVSDNTSGYDNFRAENLYISNVTGGMFLDGIYNAALNNIVVNGTVGSESHTGVGIGFGGNGHLGGGMNISVTNYTAIGTTRHGLYIAGDTNVTIGNFVSHNHSPPHNANGLAALAISRSTNVNASGMAFRSCDSVCIQIDSDSGGPARNINVSNFSIWDALKGAISVGSDVPWRPGTTEVRDVAISGGTVVWDTMTPTTYPIVLGQVDGLQFRNMYLRNGGHAIGGLIRVHDLEVTHQTNLMIDDIQVSAPSTEYVVAALSGACTGTGSIRVSNIHAPGVVQPFVCQSAITNPNFSVHNINGVATLQGQVRANPATSGSRDTAVMSRVANNATGALGQTLDTGLSATSAQHAAWLQSRLASDLSRNYDLWLNPNGGNVAIGYTTPQAPKLAVNGTIGGTSITASAGFAVSTLTTWANNQPCTAGQMTWDENFIYVCTAANTVKRAALSSFK